MTAKKTQSHEEAPFNFEEEQRSTMSPAAEYLEPSIKEPPKNETIPSETTIPADNYPFMSSGILKTNAGYSYWDYLNGNMPKEAIKALLGSLLSFGIDETPNVIPKPPTETKDHTKEFGAD